MTASSKELHITHWPALLARGASLDRGNQAWPRERLGMGDSQALLTVLRDQLRALGKGRTAWVSLRNQKLQALAGARRRGAASAWEVDYLFDFLEDDAVLGDLLVSVIKAAGRRGAEKLFLRLPLDARIVNLAREAGFLPYKDEVIYLRRGRLNAVQPQLREATPADRYPLFRLYTQVTPEVVRRSEAVTYGEWQAALDTRWLRGGVELVAGEADALSGWVRAARCPQGVLIDLLLDNQRAPDVTALIAAAAHRLAATDQAILVLAPTENAGLCQSLEAAGFSPQATFLSLMHRTTRPLTLSKAIPAVAKNAVGV